jgi:hypothetical protein
MTGFLVVLLIFVVLFILSESLRPRPIRRGLIGETGPETFLPPEALVDNRPPPTEPEPFLDREPLPSEVTR